MLIQGDSIHRILQNDRAMIEQLVDVTFLSTMNYTKMMRTGALKHQLRWQSDCSEQFGL